MAGDSHILFQPITALTAVGPYRSLASRQAIVWTYRPGLEAEIKSGNSVVLGAMGAWLDRETILIVIGNESRLKSLPKVELTYEPVAKAISMKERRVFSMNKYT
ncbi:hypothetical protein M0802_008478 [Mischocyttarus mexicanus]|nr:hypothetical protein M0802_008478 [Mischocyttarus mexicanus]